MKIVLFSCSAETYFRPLPYTFLTPLPPLFPSFLPPLPSSGIFQPCLVLAKSTKKAFSEATRPCTRDICLFWDWGRKSCRPESRRLLQGNVSVRRSLSPAERPQSAAMGEMQGALARARLESLLRPRHKKRAEAQKRSESVLLSGLGKQCRPARGGLSYGGVWVGGSRMETGGRRRTETGGCESGTGSGDRGEGEVGAEACTAVLRSRVLERKWKITGTPHPSSPLRLPGRREAECRPTPGSCSHSRWNPHPCQGGPHSPPRIRRPATRIRPGLGQQPERRPGAEPSDGRGPERRFLIVPPVPPPRRRSVYKGGRSPERTVG